MKRIVGVVIAILAVQWHEITHADDLGRIGLHRGPVDRSVWLSPTRDPRHIGGIQWRDDRFEYVTYGQIKAVPAGAKRTFTEFESSDIQTLRDPFRVIDGRVENITRILQQFEAKSMFETNGWHRITGTVLQNMGTEGLLISTYHGEIRVRGCPWANNLVDGASFKAVAKARGIYRYTSILRATRSVASYDYGEIPDASQWASIRAAIDISKKPQPKKADGNGSETR